MDTQELEHPVVIKQMHRNQALALAADLYRGTEDYYRLLFATERLCRYMPVLDYPVESQARQADHFEALQKNALKYAIQLHAGTTTDIALVLQVADRLSNYLKTGNK